jgi:hypothetical protein
MLKTILTAAAIGLALLAAPASATQAAPYPPATQQSGPISPQQLLLGTWALEAAAGATVATYFPDGSVNGVVYLRGRPQPIPFQGSWSVRPLGSGHFELTITAGGRSDRDTLRVMADGNLFNEKARAVAYRVY